MHSNSERVAEQTYLSMRTSCPTKEKAHLERVYIFREKFIEAWVSTYRNLGMRTTQRAEGMNNTLKRLLRSDAHLVDLFHALREVNENHEGARVFMEFRMRDKHRAYPQLISPMAGQVPRFIFDLVEDECNKIRMLLIIETAEDGDATFADTFQVAGACSCNCPFFLQYSAPCAHLWLIAGEAARNLFHPAWKVSSEPVTQPAILYGPRQEPRVSAEEVKRAEFAALASDFQARLLDMDIDMGISFYKTFHDMLNRGSTNAPVAIQDPPVSRPRGRPSKRSRNTFQGNSNF